MKKRNNLTIDDKRKRRQEKLAKKRNKSLVALFLIVTAFFIIIALFFFIYQSDLVTVTNVTIKGNHYLNEGQILKAAAPPKHSNFFNFPVSSIEKRVKTLPWVEGADVYKSFPGGIVIQINERKPFAYISNVNLLYIVDTKGYVISAESFKRFNLPRIENVTVKKIIVGKRINNDSFKNMVEAYLSLPKSLRSKIISISSPVEEELTFTVKGIDIIYGSAEQNQMKGSVINKLLHSKDSSNLSLIDVRVPTQPVTRSIIR